MRGFTLGVLDSSMIGHAAVLVAMGAVGTVIAWRRVTGLLHA
jgi:hypothetical protein